MDWLWLHESFMLVCCIHFCLSHKQTPYSLKLSRLLIQSMCLLESIINTCSDWLLCGNLYMCWSTLVCRIHFLSLSPVAAVKYSYRHTVESQKSSCLLVQPMCLLVTITNSCSDWRLSVSHYMSFCTLVCHGHFGLCQQLQQSYTATQILWIYPVC